MGDDEYKLDPNVMDIDDDSAIDFNNIKPIFFINRAIFMAQKTLMYSVIRKEGIREGLMAYYVFVEHVEMLCRSSGYITEFKKDDPIYPLSYDFKINEFCSTDDYKNEKDSAVAKSKLANYKLRLIMEAVFKKAVKTTPLKV